MIQTDSILKGKTILAVDDEADVLETIVDILDEVRVDTARDYPSASAMLHAKRYDLTILDIMGVDGLTLLEESVERQIPAVMLTAHAINQETLMESIRKGAIAYLPKEKLADLDRLLETILAAHQRGEAPWKLLFDELGTYFEERFGPGWQESDKAFWNDFTRTYQIGRGIRQRLLHDDIVKGRGV